MQYTGIHGKRLLFYQEVFILSGYPGLWNGNPEAQIPESSCGRDPPPLSLRPNVRACGTSGSAWERALIFKFEAGYRSEWKWTADKRLRKVGSPSQDESESIKIRFTTREAKEDFEFNGVKYKAGTSIISPPFDIQRDERYWRHPLKFDPERFSPENTSSFHNLTYQPFGIGPRNCVGLRLALLEMIYTAARMVLKFELKLGGSQKASHFLLLSIAL